MVGSKKKIMDHNSLLDEHRQVQLNGRHVLKVSADIRWRCLCVVSLPGSPNNQESFSVLKMSGKVERRRLPSQTVDLAGYSQADRMNQSNFE